MRKSREQIRRELNELTNLRTLVEELVQDALARLLQAGPEERSDPFDLKPEIGEVGLGGSSEAIQLGTTDVNVDVAIGTEPEWMQQFLKRMPPPGGDAPPPPN